jgi:hypothetical protein
MIRKVLLGSLLLLLIVAVAGAEGPQDLKIVSVKPVKSGIYAIASVEFPKAWSDPAFTVEVNGKAVRMRRVGGGFSEDRNMADLMFMPGKAAKQSVAVKCTAGGRKTEARAGFDWTPAPFIAVLGHTGNREMITTREKLTVAAANVTGVKVFFNGKEVHARPSAGDIETLTFDPAWKKGKNVLTINADKWDGGMIARNFTFFDLGEGGTLPPGQSALVHLGREGTKSGPFYDVKVEGDSIAPPQGTTVRRDIIDGDGWLVSETWVAAELRARKEGTAKIRVFVKPHFLQKMELEREFTITVAGE